MFNKTNQEVQNMLMCMQELGLRIDLGGVSRDIISRSLDLDTHLPGTLIHQVYHSYISMMSENSIEILIEMK